MSEAIAETQVVEVIDLGDAEMAPAATFPQEAVVLNVTFDEVNMPTDPAVHLITQMRAERANTDRQHMRTERIVGGLGIINVVLGLKVGHNLLEIGSVLTTWAVAAVGIRKFEPPKQSEIIDLEDQIMRDKGLT